MRAVTPPAFVARRLCCVIGTIAFFAASIVAADDLHQIVETKSRYLLGASSDGKWIKAERAAKEFKAGTSFRLYSLTSEVGTTEGGEVHPEEDVCPETQVVSTLKTPESAVIGLAAQRGMRCRGRFELPIRRKRSIAPRCEVSLKRTG